MIRRAGAAVFAVFAIAGCSDGDGRPSADGSTTVPDRETQTAVSTNPGTTAATTLRPFALAATRRCLVARGAAVSKVGTGDARLRELGDLAQRTSIEVRSGGDVAGLAFGNADLLQSLLRSPNNPYRLEVRRNVLLMYRPAASSLARLVRDCLRV